MIFLADWQSHPVQEIGEVGCPAGLLFHRRELHIVHRLCTVKDGGINVGWQKARNSFLVLTLIPDRWWHAPLSIYARTN